MLDYHVHLWPHGESSHAPSVEELAGFCEQAASKGVAQIALTEHLFRFAQADPVCRGFWSSDAPALADAMAAYWDGHQAADLDAYVDAVLEAKAAGLPVVLGLEVDWYPDRMDRVAALLDGYPFDVLLGSVHWLGAWGFDNWEEPAFAAEWSSRSVESVWDEYTRALEELAATRTCDVLAHPDLCKVTGRRPAAPDEFYDRMAEAAASSGMAAEVSSAGWRKPVDEAYPAPPLLTRFRARGVPVTTASDGHGLPLVADRVFDLRSLLGAAGYTELAAFERRRRNTVGL